MNTHRWLSLVWCICSILCGCTGGRSAGEDPCLSGRPSGSVESWPRKEAACFRDIRDTPVATELKVDALSELVWSRDDKYLAFQCVGAGGHSIRIADARGVTVVRDGLSAMAKIDMGCSREIFWCIGAKGEYIPDFKAPVRTPVTLTGRYIGDVALSADGTVLAYASLFPDARVIIVGTSELDTPIITKVEFPVGVLRWSPRQHVLAVLEATESPNQRKEYLHLYDAKQAEMTDLVTDRHVLPHSWTWSGSGDCIHFAERSAGSGMAAGIWTASTDGRNSTVVSYLDDLGDNVEAAVVAPDGKGILLVVKVGQEVRELALLDVSTKTYWILARGNLWTPCWTHDSTRFAITVNGNLWVVSRNGLAAKAVFPDR